MLTPRQEAFCLAYVECGIATEAYRRAFDAPKAKDKTLHERASRLLATDKIQARIETLRSPAREAVQLTLQSHLRSLEAIRDQALAKGQYGAAATAEIARGKVSGLYIDRHEVGGTYGGPIVVQYVHEANKRTAG